MVFSTPIFLFMFLPITIILYYISPLKLRNVLLLFASLLFYAWGEPYAILVMILSIVWNYFSGIAVSYSKKQFTKRIVIIIAVTVNLFLLLVFKYAGFIVENINGLLGTRISDPNIPLPIGISFITFQAVSYVIDVYRKDGCVQKNPASLALYISFFPQLIAGPIVRYKDIDTQIRNRIVNYNQILSGCQRFIIGLAKKMLIANVLGEFVDNVFTVDFNFWTNGMAWLMILCYTLQIYFDFSAYSDMAIGIGRMFGFEFKENFNYPYKSLSIREFWRRWHISLSTWFRDYLYIPLGGSKVGKVRLYYNQLIVFLLCGLWHGASWNFVIWGILHGLFLVIERMGFEKVLDRTIKPIRYAYTILVVMLAWVFFRAETLPDALFILGKLFGVITTTPGYNVWQFVTPLLWTVIACGIIIALGLPIKLITFATKYIIEGTSVMKICFLLIKTIALAVILILSAASMASGAYSPFIYFRF